jgi:hypothetical protein
LSHFPPASSPQLQFFLCFLRHRPYSSPPSIWISNKSRAKPNLSTISKLTSSQSLIKPPSFYYQWPKGTKIIWEMEKILRGKFLICCVASPFPPNFSGFLLGFLFREEVLQCPHPFFG